ncbi:MAG: toprim domain-containing protein [Methanosaeta sp. ASP1-1]|jgi:5S rRNA maturation endonuclease (ribonuclease M5)|nr:toprim domain-containing protein [Methanothrix sp.]OYV08224.1 MAG: toprim domain-containing protein [Methanosaeta sp. ASP1-1]OYV09119.1 MAG: toprim domain-containing protein [Methanosaeta sp. NSP1]OYV11490.1 MAG: toprim domain-containing protein [Methanosaeta sp. ASM2]OYV12564.1 MAG: toprim domain-containing protein [Methanosaeta sp. NSM2]OYV12866.1 MAG: toprim domain-containing protein [Methanosaeta sp. ASO1]
MIGGRDNQESRPKRTYDLEALEELIASLLEASGQGAAVIVEGRRDLLALRSLGLCGPVIMASRLSALDVAEDAARNYSQVILLTDWDDKGDEMCQTIGRHLRSVGIRPDGLIRSRLKSLVKKEIKDVESLGRYMERMRELYGP